MMGTAGLKNVFPDLLSMSSAQVNLLNAHKACWEVVSQLQFCVYGLAGKIPEERVVIQIPFEGAPSVASEAFTGFDSLNESEIKEEVFWLFRHGVPTACKAAIAAFDVVRSKFAGVQGPVELGSFSGASAHEVVWQIAMRLLRDREQCTRGISKEMPPEDLIVYVRNWDRCFLEDLERTLDLDLLVSRLQAEYGEVVRRGEAEDSPQQADASYEHVVAGDFSSIRVNGKTYRFGGNSQKHVIKILYGEWLRGGDGTGMHQDAIGNEIDSEAHRSRFRVDECFRNHDAVGEILERVDRGTWALFLGESPRNS